MYSFKRFGWDAAAAGAGGAAGYALDLYLKAASAANYAIHPELSGTSWGDAVFSSNYFDWAVHNYPALIAGITIGAGAAAGLILKRLRE